MIDNLTVIILVVSLVVSALAGYITYKASKSASESLKVSQQALAFMRHDRALEVTTEFLKHSVSTSNETYFDAKAFAKYVSEMDQLAWALEPFAYDIHIDIIEKVELCMSGGDLKWVPMWHNEIASNIRRVFRDELRRIHSSI